MALDLDSGLKLASFILSIGAIVYAFFANRKKDTDVRFKDGSKRMDEHTIRIAALEQRVDAMPGKDDLHELQLKVAEVAGAMGKIGALLEANGKAMSRLEVTQSRVEDYLLNGGHKP